MMAASGGEFAAVPENFRSDAIHSRHTLRHTLGLDDPPLTFQSRQKRIAAKDSLEQVVVL
jgi:hypothetical protein